MNILFRSGCAIGFFGTLSIVIFAIIGKVIFDEIKEAKQPKSQSLYWEKYFKD